jgi:hypothetical protein
MNAVRKMAGCPDSGPAGIAQRWRSSPDDSLRLHDLIFASSLTRDERVLQVAIDVLSDQGKGRPTRFAALSVLWYYVRGEEPVFSTVLLNAPPPLGPRIISGAGVHAIKPTVGTHPVVGDVRQRVLDRLRQLASNTTDEPQVLMAIRESIEAFRGGRGR